MPVNVSSVQVDNYDQIMVDDDKTDVDAVRTVPIVWEMVGRDGVRTPFVVDMHSRRGDRSVAVIDNARSGFIRPERSGGAVQSVPVVVEKVARNSSVQNVPVVVEKVRSSIIRQERSGDGSDWIDEVLLY